MSRKRFTKFTIIGVDPISLSTDGLRRVIALDQFNPDPRPDILHNQPALEFKVGDKVVKKGLESEVYEVVNVWDEVVLILSGTTLSTIMKEQIRHAPADSTKRIKCYLCGKITNNPSYKTDFEQAEQEVLALGYTPVNPVVFPHKKDSTWEEYLRQDIKLLMNCEAVYLLRDSHSSKGAMLEMDLALALKFKIIYQ